MIAVLGQDGQCQNFTDALLTRASYLKMQSTSLKQAFLRIKTEIATTLQISKCLETHIAIIESYGSVVGAMRDSLRRMTEEERCDLLDSIARRLEVLEEELQGRKAIFVDTFDKCVQERQVEYCREVVARLFLKFDPFTLEAIVDE